MQPIPLSDAQRTVLTAACQREDGLVFPVTAALKGGAVGTVLKSLLKRDLVEETPATTQDNVWRHSETGQALTLRATPLTFQVLGIEPPSAGTPEEAEGGHAGVDVADQGGANADGLTLTPAPARGRRTDSKQAALIEMLRRPEGASLDEIVSATGWQAHTVRGAIAGALKKRLGLTISSERMESRGRIYRIQA